MKILGLSAFFHDSAAALINDGEIICALQEERFTRLKHDHRFPKNALEHCLALSNTQSIDELDAIVYYEKPFLTFERLIQTHMENAPWSLKSFTQGMPIWLQQKLYLKGKIKKYLRKNFECKNALPPLYFVEHHHAHAASAFYPSPFKEAAVLCLDGVGEWASSSAWLGEDNRLTPLFEIHFPHSLGLLYSSFTQYLGFKVNNGEYKLMGLSSYGEPVHASKIKDHLIDIKDDGSFRLNLEYFNFHRGSTMINKKFENLFGLPSHKPDTPYSKKEMDIAASIQAVTEEVIFKLADEIHRQTGAKNLCLSGGVALNCVANGKLKERGPFSNIWIQPAAGDAGSAIGAALICHHEILKATRIVAGDDKMRGSYLGNQHNEDDIPFGLKSQTQELSEDGLIDKVSELIIAGKVVGWFQGAMEFGPRALGSRSIIADARNTEMQKRLNLKIKKRESFRPFAASLLEEDADIFYEHGHKSPYMLLVENVKNELRNKNISRGTVTSDINQIRSTIPAVTHVDFSCRTQTVSKTSHPRYRKLIEKFKEKTGIGLIVNTSFNIRGEPIVESPNDALRCFFNTDMDALAIGNIVFEKDKIKWDESYDYPVIRGINELFPKTDKSISLWNAVLMSLGVSIAFIFNQIPPGPIYMSVFFPILLYATSGGRKVLNALAGLIVLSLDKVFNLIIWLTLILFYLLIMTPYSLLYRLVEKPDQFYPFKTGKKSYKMRKNEINKGWANPF